MAGGRPSEYSLGKAEIICDLLAEGQTLVHICALDDFPRYSTIARWLDSNEEFRKMYARARKVQADRFADETIVIADTEPDPQVARVRIDARKWHAAKTAPRKYGDRVMQEHTGADGGKIETVTEMITRPQITREEWLAIHGMDTTARTTTGST